MADPLLAGWGMGRARACLFKDALLEGVKLIRGKNEQKRFQEDDSFSKAGIDVVMVGVHGFPHSLGIRGGSLQKVCGGVAVVGAEIFDHFAQGADLGEKLEAVGEQDMVQKAAHASGFLTFLALKICRVKRSGVWDGAVMFGVFVECAKQAPKRGGEQEAKFRGDMDSLQGFAKTPVLPQLKSFIERNTKHNVVGFECFDVVAEDDFLFRRQPGAPVIFDRRSAG